ncbi:MAG TPA: RNA polymerase factor sigma-54 [Candidatus Krumholzibacteria bacterium]|nr:RNA polymerase factor sigma-54 [Candidatus Krumholzibacteria bacterium]
MKFGLQMRQTQRLVMTPKLQQALKLLQVPTLELQQILKQEILQNPMLEEVEDIEDDEEEMGAEASTQEAEEAPVAEPTEAPSETEDSSAPNDKEPDESWDDYFGDGFDLGYKRSEDQQEEFFERVPVARTSFIDSLLGQLRILTSDEIELRIGEYLVGSLNESGYLTCSLVEVANTFKVEEAVVARVLAFIQSMEPVGIGARSLQEALLIQLRQRGLSNSVTAEIIRDHFDALKQRKYTEIAKKLHISVEEVQEHANAIKDLDPKPGFELMTEEVRYITPDLIVERVGEEYVVFLNDKNVPRLRISTAYKRELDRAPVNGNKETRDFILGRLSSARWLIQTIEQRRKTMVKVMECIVDEQREFFERGPGSLRPLTLQQVASRIGMHESTVSRVTTNKYVQTPRGVFELKYFFSSSLDTEDGDEVSAKAAKSQILEIIGKEDARRPLSDQKIADILKQGGLIIARRTVAKYREQLRILPARLRKQY